MAETIRSFIAFDIENEAILRRLSDVQETLIRTGADLKLVKPQNIHITMRFLGNIAAPMIDSIFEEMDKVAFTPFDVEIRGLGAFPSLNYTRVVWAGIQKGADVLAAISGELEPNLRRLGFKPDRKGFSPHLTIARVRTGRNKKALTQCIRDAEDYEFGTVKAECLRLKKSALTPKGPIYSTLKEVCR
jgi:2'-5' RNA ligase